MSLEAHKPKKQKVEEAAAAAFAGAEQDNEATTTDTTTAIVAAQRNANGEAFFYLSKTRRVTVRQFKGKTLVDIREVRTTMSLCAVSFCIERKSTHHNSQLIRLLQFYEKDGKVLPGKKGISLNLEQYEALRDLFLGGQVEQEITNLE